MFKKGSSVPVDSISFFDTVVHPKDAVERSESEIIHSIKTETVSPITLIDNEEMLERNIVRSRLGLPLDCKVTYVQLGAGKINQIDSDIRIVVETLLKNKDMYVVITMSHPKGGEFFDIDSFCKIALDVGATGVVAPATRPEDVARVRNLVGDLEIISPGVGAQGGSSKDGSTTNAINALKYYRIGLGDNDSSVSDGKTTTIDYGNFAWHTTSCRR